jgi:hypothetical protein
MGEEKAWMAWPSPATGIEGCAQIRVTTNFDEPDSRGFDPATHALQASRS